MMDPAWHKMTLGGDPELSGGSIHIWTLRPGASREIAANFERILSADELDRAVRFRFDNIRHPFVITRGVLRCLLGRYLGRDPAQVRFAYGSKGKPGLASGQGLEFNTTHSGDLAVFAFTKGCQIGVDLEHIRPMSDAHSISTQYFCAEEAAEIMTIEPNDRERAFFLCWTRKEAYVKAIGDGLSVPLDEFRVTLQPDKPARLIHLAHDTESAKAWTLQNLCLAPDYAAALAYRDQARPFCAFPIVEPTDFMDLL